MKDLLVSRSAVLLALLAAGWLWPVRLVSAADSTTTATVARTFYEADRRALVAENLQLSEAESAAFWPLYREYRAEMEKLGDGVVKLVLEYADCYPNVPEDHAKQLLKDYSTLEQKLAKRRAAYLRKFAKVIRPAKALRLAQLENRLDLVLRLQVASGVPLVPTQGQ